LALVADCGGMTAYSETDSLPDCKVFWAATDIRRRTAKRLYESFSERPSVGKTTKLFQPACRLTSRSVRRRKKTAGGSPIASNSLPPLRENNLGVAKPYIDAVSDSDSVMSWSASFVPLLASPFASAVLGDSV
jgi:hypothetical protein